jgi:plasmid stabilization system protein ParE
MSPRIVVSAEAHIQLDDLYDYIAAVASSDTALTFTTSILDQIAALATFPNIGVARDDILPGLRTLGFRRRVTIAFAVRPTELLIVGIFYGGQDFETALKDE